MDGTTQVVKPSAEHFETWKTAHELREKVSGLVHAIAGQRPFDYYVSTYKLESTTSRLRKR